MYSFAMWAPEGSAFGMNLSVCVKEKKKKNLEIEVSKYIFFIFAQEVL